MGFYYREPNLVDDIRELRNQLDAVQRQTQQYRVPLASITRFANFSLPTGVVTPLPFNSVVFDTHNMWNASTPTVLTVPMKGVYAITANIIFDVNATGVRRIEALRNGDDYGKTQVNAVTTAGQDTSLSHTTFLQCAVGATLGVAVFQTSGVSLDLIFPTLNVVWLGVGS